MQAERSSGQIIQSFIQQIFVEYFLCASHLANPGDTMMNKTNKVMLHGDLCSVTSLNSSILCLNPLCRRTVLRSVRICLNTKVTPSGSSTCVKLILKLKQHPSFEICNLHSWPDPLESHLKGQIPLPHDPRVSSHGLSPTPG